MFRDALGKFSKKAKELKGFAGPAAALEVGQSIVQSGLEPPNFCATWEANSGVAPKSPLAHEHKNLIYLYWYFVCVDLLDPTQSAAMEATSRGILQLQRAVRKNPKAPDFVGLEPYLRHIPDASKGAHAPKFDSFVAETNKAEAGWLKQARLQQEEEEAAAKKKPKKKKGEKDEDDE